MHPISNMLHTVMNALIVMRSLAETSSAKLCTNPAGVLNPVLVSKNEVLLAAAWMLLVMIRGLGRAVAGSRTPVSRIRTLRANRYTTTARVVRHL